MESQTPPSSPNPRPEDLPTPRRIPNLNTILPWTVATLGILGVVACVFWIIPAERKESSKAREELQSEKETSRALHQQVETLSVTLQKTRSLRKTKTTQRLALDGTGHAVMGPDGMPVILTDTLVLASDAASASSSDQTNTITDLLEKGKEKDRRIAALEKSLEEKRGGGWEAMAGKGTSGAWYAHVGFPPIGILKGALEGRVDLGAGAIEGVAEIGLHF